VISIKFKSYYSYPKSVWFLIVGVLYVKRYINDNKKQPP